MKQALKDVIFTKMKKVSPRKSDDGIVRAKKASYKNVMRNTAKSKYDFA